MSEPKTRSVIISLPLGDWDESSEYSSHAWAIYCSSVNQEQKPIRDFLRKQGVEHTIFYRANQIGADMTEKQIQELLKRFPDLKIRDSEKLETL